MARCEGGDGPLELFVFECGPPGGNKGGNAKEGSVEEMC